MKLRIRGLPAELFTHLFTSSTTPRCHSAALPRPAAPGSSTTPRCHSAALPRPAAPGSSTTELAAWHAVRMIADGPGYPCRVSLTDAARGDQVVLLHYEHHAVATPFRSSYAIYVRPGERTFDEVDHVPAQLRSRLLGVRAFDADGWLLAGDVVDGSELEACAARLFETPGAAYLHAHFAKAGCYAARIDRAG